MTPPQKKPKKRKYINTYELIFGWFDTILKTPEIKEIIPRNPRYYLKRKKEQISDCASMKFIEKYDGFSLLQAGNTNEIEKYIIKSFAECI